MPIRASEEVWAAIEAEYNETKMWLANIKSEAYRMASKYIGMEEALKISKSTVTSIRLKEASEEVNLNFHISKKVA